MRSLLAALAVLLLVPAGASAGAYVGSLHEHSGWSDGWPGSTPADFYASGRAHGLDFMGGSDHSDNTALPFSTSQYCADDPLTAGCVDATPKWSTTAQDALAATTASFTAFRGFEWTSDRFGHINVYFSRDYANAKADGGYVDMSTFYGWLERSDGIATFNHPGDKKLSTSDPAYNWNDFAYVPAADAQMVGVEVYNSASDFAAPHAHGSGDDGWYVHALDKGWHVGAIGAEDLGHHYGDDWGGPGQAKTVILARDRSPAALKAAMQARRFYAVAGPQYRLAFTVDRAPMGSRLAAKGPVHVRATGPGTLELVTGGGKVLATGQGALDKSVTPDRYVFVRARVGDAVVAYSSPVWTD
jgi:hypothetical protein